MENEAIVKEIEVAEDHLRSLLISLAKQGVQPIILRNVVEAMQVIRISPSEAARLYGMADAYPIPLNSPAGLSEITLEQSKTLEQMKATLKELVQHVMHKEE